MRDAEESESEKSWKSEDEADGIRRDIPNDARSRAFEPQPKPSAGRGMSAVLPSYMQGNNPALTQSFGHGKAKKAPEPESEPSMDCSSEPSLRTTVTRTDPSDDEEPQDPWHVHGDPWQKSEPSKPSTRTRQDPGTSGTWGHDRYEQLHGKREAQNVHNGQNGNPRGPDPWADGDPWGGTSASKSQDPKQDPRDPWQGGNDPWSGSTRQDGKGGKNGDWFAKGKGSPGPEGGKPAKGKGKGEPHDPWLMNDPWGAAAGKGRNPDGKGKAVQGESRNGPSSWPQQLATVPGHAEPRREAPIQPARPKPTPPKPPSSDGEESSQRSNGGKWNRHMRTAARAPGIGPDGLPAHDAQKDKYLQYRKRCLDLLGTNYKGQTVEVQANKQIQVPGFLRCEMDEILLLRFVTDGFALLEDFPSRVGARMGWAPLDSLKPVEPYDFQVKLIREEGSRLGLLGEELEFADGLTRIMVLRVNDDDKTLLSAWNDRCQQCHPRDQLLSGDLITAVNGETALNRMLEELNGNRPLLEMNVLRHEQRLSPQWPKLPCSTLDELGASVRGGTPRPVFEEIDKFQ